MHERLAELRDLHDKKQYEVAEAIGIAESTYSNYESGKRAMNNIQLQIRLADYYNVSLDYLHGRTSIPAINKGPTSDHETSFMLKSLKLYKETRAKEKSERE